MGYRSNTILNTSKGVKHMENKILDAALDAFTRSLGVDCAVQPVYGEYPEVTLVVPGIGDITYMYGNRSLTAYLDTGVITWDINTQGFSNVFVLVSVDVDEGDNNAD